MLKLEASLLTELALSSPILSLLLLSLAIFVELFESVESATAMVLEIAFEWVNNFVSKQLYCKFSENKLFAKVE